MTKIKKKEKNKIIFILNFLILVFLIPLASANENKCKKFDIVCKSKNWVEETKEFQKKKFGEGKEQLSGTKDKIIKGIKENKL